MQTISDRIKIVRQTATGRKLTQEEFGNSLGISRSAVTNIEDAENRLPNGVPESILRLICSTYHVLYRWLTTGEGQMYEDDKEARIDRIIEKGAPNADPWFKAQLKAYATLLTDEDWIIFRDMVDKIRAQKKE